MVDFCLRASLAFATCCRDGGENLRLTTDGDVISHFSSYQLYFHEQILQLFLRYVLRKQRKQHNQQSSALQFYTIMMNKDLSYGLNPRTDKSVAAAPTRKRKGLSRFDSDSSSDESTTGRTATNKAIAAEQNALRKRAEAALTTYDYDGEYDSFTKNKPVEPKKNENKSSKYISRLLETSKRRTREQEIIYEKKIAKEQAAGDENMQFEGKEKFITSAYKLKLAEREEWMREEKEREKREQQEDVTKKSAENFLFAGFGRNILNGTVGESEENKVEKLQDKSREIVDGSGGESRRDSSTETERRIHTNRNQRMYPSHSYHVNSNASATVNNGDSKKETQAETAPVKTRKQIREERSVKIHQARERYFQRKGITLQ